MATKTQRVICRLQNKTSGALRYIETGEGGRPIKSDKDGALIGEFYLRKAALRGEVPDRIIVTIEY